MRTDFAPFPLAVAFENARETTISLVNPDSKVKFPTWGNHCWWTDPPPPECEPNICQLNADMCEELSGGLDLLKRALSPVGGASSVGKVIEGTDITNFPPHLIPLIKTISEIAKESGIDLTSSDYSGVTLTFHK